MSEILKQWNEAEDYFSHRYASSRHRCHETMQSLRWWKRRAWNSSKGKNFVVNFCCCCLILRYQLAMIPLSVHKLHEFTFEFNEFSFSTSHRISKLNWNSNYCIDVTQQQHASSVCELKFHSHLTWTLCFTLRFIFHILHAVSRVRFRASCAAGRRLYCTICRGKIW